MADVDCVISAQAIDDPEISRFRRSKLQLRELAKRFRDPDDLVVRLVIGLLLMALGQTVRYADRAAGTEVFGRTDAFRTGLLIGLTVIV